MCGLSSYKETQSIVEEQWLLRELQIGDWDGSGAAPPDAAKIPHPGPAGSRAAGSAW